MNIAQRNHLASAKISEIATMNTDLRKWLQDHCASDDVINAEIQRQLRDINVQLARLSDMTRRLK